jgi:hypothetical protein
MAIKIRGRSTGIHWGTTRFIEMESKRPGGASQCARPSFEVRLQLFRCFFPGLAGGVLVLDRCL